MLPVIYEKGKPAPLAATKRWVAERTNSSWNNAHKKLVWCTERRDRVIDFWIAFSEVVIIVRRLIGEGWSHYSLGGLSLSSAMICLLAEALSPDPVGNETGTIASSYSLLESECNSTNILYLPLPRHDKLSVGRLSTGKHVLYL